RSQAHDGTAVDGQIGIVRAGARGEDEGDVVPRNGGATVHQHGAAIDDIGAVVQGYRHATVEMETAAIDAWIKDIVLFAVVVVVIAAGERGDVYVRIGIGRRRLSGPDALGGGEVVRSRDAAHDTYGKGRKHGGTAALHRGVAVRIVVEAAILQRDVGG